MPPPPATIQLSRRRRRLFAALLLLATWGLAELASLAFLSILKGRPATPARFRADREAVRQEALARTAVRDPPRFEIPASLQVSVLHPFLGFVEDPTVPHSIAISGEGFSEVQGQGGVPPERRFTVALFGGSVAQHLCLGPGGEVLRAELAALPEAAGKAVWIDCRALGGYKQPQQAMALAYALAGGARFDLVLHLDGFNEVALALAENVPSGVNPYYPRGWHVLSGASLDLALLRRAGEMSYLQYRRAKSVDFLEGTPLRFSPMAHVVWKTRDRLARERLTELQLLEVAPPEKRSFLRSGPDSPPRTEIELVRDLAAFWGRSSRLMDGLCRVRGIPYLHFLQPNQYVEGSKPMGAAERKVAISERSVYGRGARLGYGELIATGAGLRKEGERYFDLTAIFRDVQEPLYVDDCCHLNREGMERLAREMAARVKAEVGRSGELGPS